MGMRVGREIDTTIADRGKPAVCISSLAEQRTWNRAVWNGILRIWNFTRRVCNGISCSANVIRGAGIDRKVLKNRFPMLTPRSGQLPLNFWQPCESIIRRTVPQIGKHHSSPPIRRTVYPSGAHCG